MKLENGWRSALCNLPPFQFRFANWIYSFVLLNVLFINLISKFLLTSLAVTFKIVELKGHPFYVGVQFHPEFKSRPGRPSPLFLGNIYSLNSDNSWSIWKCTSIVHCSNWHCIVVLELCQFTIVLAMNLLCHWRFFSGTLLPQPSHTYQSFWLHWVFYS